MVLVFLVWFWLLPNDGNPRTIGQAVERLQSTLPSDMLDSIAASKEDDLVMYHFSLGMHIRNEYGLWKGNLRLVISTGHLSALHPDSASGYIIHALWKELRKQDTSFVKSKQNKTAKSGRGDRIAPVTPPTPPGVRVRTGRFQSDHGALARALSR